MRKKWKTKKKGKIREINNSHAKKIQRQWKINSKTKKGKKWFKKIGKKRQNNDEEEIALTESHKQNKEN